MSFAGLHRLSPVYHYDDLDGDPESIAVRRLRERWWTIEFCTRISPRTGLPEYDPFADWIMNGRETSTFEEWLIHREQNT